MNARLLACVATVALVAVALTGCSLPALQHPTGKKGLQQVLGAFGDTDHVDVYTEHGAIWTGHGPAVGSVELRSTRAGRVKAVVDALGSFLSGERGASVDWDSVTLTTGIADLEVRDRRDVNDEERRALTMITADNAFTYADIDRELYATVSGHDVIGPFERLESRLSHYREVGSTGLEVASDDANAAFSIFMYDPQTPPDAEIAAYESITQRFTPLGASIRRGDVEITLRRSQVGKARDLVDVLGFPTWMTVTIVPADPSTLDETP